MGLGSSFEARDGNLVDGEEKATHNIGVWSGSD